MFHSNPATSLKHPDMLRSLYALIPDYDIIRSLISSYATWESLTTMSLAEKVNILTPQYANVVFPAVPPTPPAISHDVAVHSVFDSQYPFNLRVAASPPLVLFSKGNIFENKNLVAVIGASHPNAAGVEVAKASGVCATVTSTPIVAPLIPGCSTLALWAAAKTKGAALAVLPHGFNVTSSQQLLVDTILNAGGGVVTAFESNTRSSGANERAAARLAVQMSYAVILAEVGLHEAAGVDATRQAVQDSKFLVVPSPESLNASGTFVSSTAFGSTVFSNPREWSQEYFGSNSRIKARCINGLTPADVVINTQKDLLEMLKKVPTTHNS